MSKPRLVVLTRFPEPGSVKTRLIPKLGREGAADLHRDMAEFTLTWARSLSERGIASLEVWFDGGDRERMAQWLGRDLDFREQGEGDLGDRMVRAVRSQTTKPQKKPVILVGTDCPQLNAVLVEMVIRELRGHDVVLIPTDDGGYCLIAVKAQAPELFHSMDWGMDSVFQTTLRRAEGLGLKVKSFERLHDVDTPEDLHIWDRASSQLLSIIIPTLNERDNLRETVTPLLDIPRTEVIVADGGSRDGTVLLAKELGVAVLVSPPGRGNQLNLGADASGGAVLLFLHADTRLPAGFAHSVRQALENPRVVGGSFAWHAEPSSPWLRYIGATVNLRTKYLRLPYGDQALFVRSSLFRQMGGFADIPLMEDVEFVRRLNRVGRMAFLPEPVTTSARKYLRRGAIRTTLRNKLIVLGYLLGVPPERLYRIYYGRPAPNRSPPSE